MHKPVAAGAFALGLGVIGWVAFGYLGVSPLALAMTLLIGAVYAVGGLELLRFHRATQGLQAALDTLPAPAPEPGAWLAGIDPTLRNAVRSRIDGERSALPGPAMTPYLVGLLVLLGMLGTFVGMVVTLQGAVKALESTTDLATIRAALSAPVRGLGVAFGTSVAGVAASAMLGLVSALCRRARQQAAELLDLHAATTWRAHGPAHHRQQVLQALQQQAQLLPAVVAQLQTLGERLAEGQQRFHGEASAAYGALAQSVDQSLKASLAEGARVAGAAIQPAVEATLAGLAREAGSLQQRLADTAQAQADGLAARFQQQSAELLALLQQAWQQAAERAQADALAQQQQICSTIETTARALQAGTEAQARETIAEVSRLMDTAAAAPRAAAEVVQLLREKLSESIARDNGLLDERARLLAALGTLLEAVQRTADDQRAAVQALVAQSAALLQQAGERFGAMVEAEAAKISSAAAEITVGAVDVASLGEAFGAAVAQFGTSSDALAAHLQRIEAALDKTSARSDEQLAYYVAQAREIVELSIGSQRQIVDDLRQIALRPAPLAGEVA